MALDDLPPVDGSDLLGTWHIVETTFPMWLRGDKHGPTLNYSAHPEPGRLGDLVRYRDRRGRTREIRGTDRQDPSNPAHFTWRGRGLLWLLSSDWYVIHHDAQAGLAVIFFTKTLFTPAGVDIIARTTPPSAEALAEGREALSARPDLRAHLAALVAL